MKPQRQTSRRARARGRLGRFASPRLAGPLVVGLYLALGLGACAHGPRGTVPHAAGLAAPAVASADAAPADEAVVAGTASILLERALEALQQNRPDAARAALAAALSTGDLNEAGRALAYWYIYVAEQAQGHVCAARDALADFVVVGDEVLLQRHDMRFADRDGSDFVDRFDLLGRLARSRATLSLAWAARVAGFGRSVQQAVPVRDSQEIDYFLELAPPCAHRLDRQAVAEVLDAAGGSVTHVQLRCGNAAAPAHYFFAHGHRRLESGAKRTPSHRRHAPSAAR